MANMAPMKKRTTPVSPEKKAGAQRQITPRQRAQNVMLANQPKSKAAKLKRRASLKIAASGDPQRRLDVMRAAGYTQKQLSDFMQSEGKRLMQRGWERQNVGRFQPP